MTTILAIETATEACSAALLTDGQLFSRFECLPQGHSGRILAMCDEVLDEAGLTLAGVDAIAFGSGPGSFTGLRIAASVAQGMATGAGCGVIAISTLAALAQSTDADRVFAALDARMGEIYSGFYIRDEQGMMRRSGVERVGKPDDIHAPDKQDWTGAGSGFAAWGDEIVNSGSVAISQILPDSHPEAASVARLARDAFRSGGTAPAESATPVYLRDNVAKKSRHTLNKQRK